MKRNILKYFFAVIFICISCSAASASDSFTYAEEALSSIYSLASECDEKGFPCDIQKANAEIIREFIECGRHDLMNNRVARAEYIRSKVVALADDTRAGLDRILALNKGIAVPRYNGDDITSDGMNFKDSNGVNQFFGGYLIFADEQDKLPLFEKMGNNLYSWEIGPSSTIVEEGTFLPSWQTSTKDGITIEADNTVFHDGGTSVKLTCDKAIADGDYAELKQTILVKPAKTYQVDIWLKGDNALGNSVYLNNDQDKKLLPEGTYDWKRVTYEVNTGEEQTSLIIRFIVQNITAGLWVDGISIREKGRDYNYINNGSFEAQWQEDEFLVNQGAMSYIKAVMDEARENNIAAVILLSPHYVPDWFWTSYPRAYGYQEGFLKGNVEDNTYKKFIKTHVQAVARAAGGYPNLHSMVLTNEPIYSTIYYTNGIQTFKNDFINYLREKYNSPNGDYIPEQMKRNWGLTRTYKWSELSMPDANTISSDGKFWDWMEYNNKVFTGFHKWLADTVHEADSSIPVHAKLCDVSFKRSMLDKGIDIEEMYSYLDYNGFDGGMYYNSDRAGYLHIRMAEDLANSISETPAVNSENHILPDDCTDYSDKHAQVAGADLWQGFLHGRTASSAWLWRRHDTWTESRNSIAYRPDLVANISAKTMNANRFSEEITKLQNTERIFYILYSNVSLLYNETEYMSACNNAYEALWSVGQRASFITEKQIASGKLDNNAVLVIPSTLNIDECALEKLNSFDGKTIVVGNTPSGNEYNLDIRLALMNEIAVSNDISSIRAAYENILNEKGIPIITVKDSDGNYIGMTDVRAADDGESILINICNNTWEDKSNISVYYGERRLDNGFNVISGEEIENDFTLTPFEPMLIRFYDSEIFPQHEISGAAAYSRNNGALIKWNGTRGIVSASCGEKALGSILAANGYMYIGGLENGREYTIDIANSESEEIYPVRVIPGTSDVTVYAEGAKENGYAYRIVNNTKDEVKYDFRAEDINIHIILPPWGEKLVQTGNEI